jgi:Kef-type K+ transport system membrane component KefB
LTDFSLPIHDPVLIFALVMLIVLLAPLVFGRLRIPGIVGLIVAGAVVGPSGLGMLERDSTMILLGTVGLLYLMFVAGIALDLNQFNKLRTRSLIFGLISFFVPQLLGIAAGIYLLGYTMPSSVLLGSIVGSHTLLAYPIASRLGLTKNAAVTTTMGGTIVTDLLALLLLAVVARFTEGAEGILFWLLFVGMIVAYLAAVVAGLPRVGRWFLKATRNDPNVSFIFMVTALFVTAYLAQLAGLAPIIGAFLAGIVLNRLVPEVGPLMSRIRFVGEVFFIPFFLISVGMLVDFRSLAAGIDVWIAAVLYTSAVVGGKFTAARIAQSVYGHSGDEAWLIFGLTVPQAAATLAVTLVGFEIGLFDQTVVNAVVIMILFTSLLGPWLVERYGRRVALKQEDAPYRPSDAPQRILIPLSNPATAHALVDVALSIRRDDSEEPVYPLTVVRPDGAVAAQVAAGEQLVGEAVVHAVAADIPVTPMTRVDENAAHGIARAVAERRISHVVIGWGGPAPPIERIFGSVLDRLLDTTTETVFVARLSRPVNTIERLIVVVPPFAEREPGFDQTAEEVKRMAGRIGAHLGVLASVRHAKNVERHVRAARPDVPVDFSTLLRYDRLLDVLSGTFGESDLVILLSARKDQISWRPLLDRLPRMFTRSFPDQDFVVVYPTQLELAAEPERSTPVSGAGYLVEVDATTPRDALREALRRALQNAESSRVVRELQLDDIDVHQHEMGASILLLHVHTPLVSQQLRLAATRRGGISVEGASHRIRAIFILVNPLDLSPSEHLRALARMASVAHAVEDLSYDEMLAAMAASGLFGEA